MPKIKKIALEDLVRQIPTSLLKSELDRRGNVVELEIRKSPLIFKCETCLAQIRAGQTGFFADFKEYGKIWHYGCTDRANREGRGRMKLVSGTCNWM